LFFLISKKKFLKKFPIFFFQVVVLVAISRSTTRFSDAHFGLILLDSTGLVGVGCSGSSEASSVTIWL
jgi:hypothetical protein